MEWKQSNGKWGRFRKKYLRKHEQWDGTHLCEKCYRPIENPDLHHKKPRSTHPHLIYEPDNIKILCRPCHQKRHRII